MKLLKKILAGCAVALFANTAQADIVQIQLSGFNFTYDQASGSFSSSSDSLVTMTFLVNGGLVGIFTSPPSALEADMFVDLANGTDPTVNATTPITADLGIFDIDIDSGTNFLQTDIDTGSVTFSNSGVNATGTGFSSIFAQDLPFSLLAENPINWSFSSGTGACTGNPGELVCTYAGTGELSWETSVPEPSALLLLGLGLLVLSGTAVRRRT